MKLREALQASLAAMVKAGGDMAPSRYFADLAPAIELARAALAEPVADAPVARVYYDCGECPYPTSGCPDRCAKSTRPAAADQMRAYVDADRAQQSELPTDLSLEQLDEKLAAWLHLNLYGYVDARPKGGGAQLESFTDEQIVKAIEDAGHNLAYRNYEQDIECGRAVIAAYRAQTVPTPAQLPKKPPFIGSAQEGLPERQWLMSLKDLEEYLAQHGAQMVPLTDERTPMDAFENAIRKVGVVAACEWFGHAADSDFTKETIKVLSERAQITPEEGSIFLAIGAKQ